MRYVKLILLIPLSLPLVAFASDETVPVDDGFAPALFAIALLFFAVCLVLVGVGIVLALTGLTCFALFVAFGIVSSSVIISLVRRRVSAGIRAFHYQLFALVCAPCGVIAFELGASLFHIQLRHRYILLWGLLAGVCAGIVMAFLFDQIARLIYYRLISRNEDKAR